MIKAASAEQLPLVEDIMRRIHDEEPSYWPHGLTKEHFNGGLYLVQKSASAEPVGFVGWQELPENNRRVGYYAIGILPEHREHGFAKEAVSQVMRKMSSRCDEVKAFIMEHNRPSLALADSLSIPVRLEKLAMEKSGNWRNVLKTLLWGGGTAGAVDSVAYGGDGVTGAIGDLVRDGKVGDDFDSASLGDFALNAVMGGAAPHTKSMWGKVGLPAGAQATTIGFGVNRNARTTHDIARKANEISKNKTEVADVIQNLLPKSDGGGFSVPTGAWIGAGLLGAGGIAALIYNAAKKRELKERELEQAEEGLVNVTLPTKNPGDVETQIRLPIGDLNLSKSLRGRLGRDTRRRLIAETRQRTQKRTPRSQEKAAAIIELAEELFPKLAMAPQPAPQGAVPMPPQMGQNPAMRMQQQEATANSIQPSTDANPQIMQAQQQAMQAEQAAAQQQAQTEQAAQQAQMEQQQGFQQELMKKETELETLKLENEKQKAQADLEKAVGKAQSDAASAGGDGDATQVQGLVSNRIKRLQSRVTKAAAYMAPALQAPPLQEDSSGQQPPMPAGAAGKQELPPLQQLRPEAAQIYNKNPGTSAALPPTGIYRHSYGKIGDMLFNFLGKNMLYAPRAPKPSRVSRTSMINTPDKIGMINRILTNATSGSPTGAMTI